MDNNPPSKPNEASGGSSFSGERSAVVTLTDDFEVDSAEYSSSTGGENVVLLTGGEALLSSPKITKTGDESSENSDFYGTNAAVLVSGGNLTIDGGSVETSASHANAVFSYGDGEIMLKNTKIKTTGNNSGGVMVTGGGGLTAVNVSVETSGNSSAAIRSDRGGGDLSVTGGSYQTSGMGSPAIYSTAAISVTDAELTSTSSEGVVIEGSNSVDFLGGVSLTDTNNTLNGNSETYKNIFIYQSMSGDAEEGTGAFTSSSSTITTNQGDTFFVTNTTARIILTNNKIVNNDSTGAFLRAQSGKWGTSGKNGGTVDLRFGYQVAEGDIILDSISSLSFLLENNSYYKGTINGEDSAASVSLELDESSTVVLTGDSYVSSLKNAASENTNIYSNGYNLYVAGEKVSLNDSAAPEVPEVVLSSTSEEEPLTTTGEVSTGETTSSASASLSPSLIISLAVCGVLLLGLVIFAVLKLRKKSPKSPEVILPNNLPKENPFISQTPPASPQNTSSTPENTSPDNSPNNPIK